MASTTNISTYELLVKPIIDSAKSLNAPNRIVIQGYFLTISNPSLSNLTIQLTFQARTPNFDSSPFPLVAFWDIDDTNQSLTPSFNFPGLLSYTFDLPALDTGLFLLQPDFTKMKEEKEETGNRNTEIRGYVRLRIASASNMGGSEKMRTLLLSAQHRGTFLPQGEGITSDKLPTTGDYDQLGYSLPLATGAAEVTLEPSRIIASGDFTIPNRERISEAIEKNPAFLSDLTSEPLAQEIAKLSPEEQQKILDILMERFQGNPQAVTPDSRLQMEVNGNVADANLNNNLLGVTEATISE
ncbi:MAG: hypothetical protein WBF90_34110 [Rivularia sp. (in: cyanobacteria)]